MSQKQKTFTKHELDVYLRREWAKKIGRAVADDARVGLSIDELIATSEKRNNEIVDQHFDLWLAAYDEFVSWLLSLLSIVYSERQASAGMTDFEKAVALLLMRILSDCFSMRILMQRGFDTSARVILRSTSEHIEILIAIISDPTLAAEFVKSDSPNEAARFWKRHIARGSLRPRIKKAWLDFFGGKGENKRAARWFANWGSRDHQMYSAISHPSFLGCMKAVLPWKAEVTEEKWLGFFGDKSLSSIDTVQTFLSFLFPLLLVIGDFPFGKTRSGFMKMHRYSSKDELHQHVRHGRSVLGSLIMSLNHEVNHEYILPEKAIMWV